MNKKFNAIDLFCGCGGLSEGLKQAGFDVIAGVEIDTNAAEIYRMNHLNSVLFENDIRKLDLNKILKLLNNKSLHLLAGCPPCQGFSSIRRLNRKMPVIDERNDLIIEFFRFVEGLNPLTVMLENVPGIIDFKLFKNIVNKLEALDYIVEYKVVDISKYGIPQRRKRLVLIASRIGKIDIVPDLNIIKTVRDVIGNLENVENTKDPIHKIYPKHIPRIQDLIANIPKNGGSRCDLPRKFWLKCHLKNNVGFNDVYGRLKWDSISSTITGGCLNPSKGRFLHPNENRCITAREAALLQTFPKNYKFSPSIPKSKLALLIGNALPPEFSRIQAKNIFKHLNRLNCNA